MDNLTIKKLTKEYVELVAELELELIGSSSFDTIEKTLESETIHYYVLLKNEKLIDFFECSMIPPESELYDIGISTDYQGKGYSKFLMNFYIELVKSNGCDTILLEVNNINNKAINLYKKFGFEEYGKRKNYYGENDAILMKLQV